VFIACDFHGAHVPAADAGAKCSPSFFLPSGQAEIQAISAILLPKRQGTLNEMAMGSKRFLES
jgi:hypothetical protein